MNRAAYRDEHAVRVLQLPGFVSQQLGEALSVAHSHDADVVIEAESLDEGEMDLQSNVTLELLVHRQHAESHAVRITAKQRGKFMST